MLPARLDRHSLFQPDSPVPVPVLHKAPNRQQTWKNKQKVSPPAHPGVRQHKGEGRLAYRCDMQGSCETTAALIPFGLKRCKVPPASSDSGQSPSSETKMQCILYCRYCNRNWLQWLHSKFWVSWRVTKGAVGKGSACNPCQQTKPPCVPTAEPSQQDGKWRTG